MTENPELPNRRVSDHLHPLVYAAAAGFVLWFALSAWVFFGDWQYMGLLLAVVTGFFLVAMAIPFTLWSVWRRHCPEDARPDQNSFRDWVSGEFEIRRGRRKGTDAMIEILLPLAAAAVGMTAMGIIFHFMETSATGL